MSKSIQHSTLSDLPAEVPLPFARFWETSDEPWGFKDQNSKYVYANTAFFDLLNLPRDFKIKDCLDKDLGHGTWGKIKTSGESEEKIGDSRKVVSSVETHRFGRKSSNKEQPLQPYIFDNHPIFNAQEEYIGAMFHGKKMNFLTCGQYVNHESPLKLLFEKPQDPFNPENSFDDAEFDVVFFLLQDDSNKVIAKKLELTEQQVKAHRKAVYKKAKIDVSKVGADDVPKVNAEDALAAFKAFCKTRGYDGYVPQKFFKPSSMRVSFFE